MQMFPNAQLDSIMQKAVSADALPEMMRSASLHFADNSMIISSNKTRQGYARKRILKPAGYFFVRREA